MIQINNLYKRYGHKIAVNNINFTVNRGDILGFIGPNGAGKSTTMKMISGFIPMSSGSIDIDGESVSETPLLTKSKIGYLPESAPVYFGMTVHGFLSFCAEMRGLTGKAKREAVEAALEACFLQDVRKQVIDTLSKGFRHRTSLAQALLGNPDILLLDEPTDGLDPNQKHEVRNLIRHWGKDKAIVISTHILEEVSEICNRVVLINAGEIVFDGSPDEFRIDRDTYILETVDTNYLVIEAALKTFPEINSIRQHKNCGAVISFSHEDFDAVAKHIGSREWGIRTFCPKEQKMNETFRILTQGGVK